jgi:hypothetical protein
MFDWEEELDSLRIDISSLFSGAVTISRWDGEEWTPLLPDMAPSILDRSGFPSAIVRAARLVAKDGIGRFPARGGSKKRRRKPSEVKRRRRS